MSPLFGQCILNKINHNGHATAGPRGQTRATKWPRRDAINLFGSSPTPATNHGRLVRGYASKSAHFRNRNFPERNRPNSAKSSLPMGLIIILRIKQKWRPNSRWFSRKMEKVQATGYPINQSTTTSEGNAQTLKQNRGAQTLRHTLVQ